MIETITVNKKPITNEDRYFSKLKNLYFSLYEINQELSAAQSPKKFTMSYEENEYLEILRSRQSDQTNKIKELLNGTAN
jgi:hypothetical protein